MISTPLLPMVHTDFSDIREITPYVVCIPTRAANLPTGRLSLSITWSSIFAILSQFLDPRIDFHAAFAPKRTGHQMIDPHLSPDRLILPIPRRSGTGQAFDTALRH